MPLLPISPYELKIPLQPASVEFIGPLAPMDYRIWRALVDYSKWHQWMDAVVDVKPSADIEYGPHMGRGCVFHLHGVSKVSTLEILHWSPSQTFIYSLGPPQRRFACCYDIDFDAQQHLVSIVLSGEVEVFGLRRLIGPLLAWRFKKVLARQCQRFVTVIMAQR
ncbi:MAG: hypothetical protein ACI95C_002703 [Pseudohongiellaceae bacterium]|jgi:hypothetical protein